MSIRQGLLATILALATSAASAIPTPLSALVAGDTLTVDDVVFSGFTFGNDGDDLVLPNDILVTTSSTANSVSLRFDFDPEVVLTINDYLEIFGEFVATIDAASTRTFVSTSLELLDVSASDGYVEGGQEDVPSNTLLNNVLFDDTFGVFDLFDSTVLAGPTSLNHEWFVVSELDLRTGTTSVGAFEIGFELSGTLPPVDPPPNGVPTPAVLPLMLGGLALLAMRRRAKSANL